MKDQRTRAIMIRLLLGTGALVVLLAAILNDGEKSLVLVVAMGTASLIMFLAAGFLNAIDEKERAAEWDDTLEKMRKWDRRIR